MAKQPANSDWDRDAALTTARILLEIQAINFRPDEPYTFTSGWKSPVYIDCRRIIFFPRARSKICELSVEKINRHVGYETIEAVAGGETAGIPFAAWIADRMSAPMAYVRKQAKGFGRNALIEGDVPEGKRTLLVEDLTTDGQSKIRFAQALRDAGAIVNHTFVVFFYGVFPGAFETLARMDIALHHLCTWWDVLEACNERTYFSRRHSPVSDASWKTRSPGQPHTAAYLQRKRRWPVRLLLRRKRNFGLGLVRMRLARLLLLAFMMMLPSVAMAQQAADWPHTIATPNGATATVYQPQAISWPDQKTLTTRMALAITPAGAKTPVLGTLEISFATVVDNATHLVTLSDSKLIASHFPTLDTAQAGQLQDRIGALLPTLQLKQVPLDAIVLSLKDLPQTAQPVAVNNDPPTIFHADRPASLVVFDGDPVMALAGNSGLKFAVNTNWDVFQAADGTWYLLNNGTWLSAPAATGPYKAVTKLPPAFSRLPSDANFADVRKAVPAKPVAAAQVPTIVISMKPAEIIVTDGAIQFVAISGTSLQYVKNTASDLFFDTATGQVLLHDIRPLVLGRRPRRPLDLCVQ